MDVCAASCRRCASVQSCALNHFHIMTATTDTVTFDVDCKTKRRRRWRQCRPDVVTAQTKKRSHPSLARMCGLNVQAVNPFCERLRSLLCPLDINWPRLTSVCPVLLLNVCNLAHLIEIASDVVSVSAMYEYDTIHKEYKLQSLELGNNHYKNVTNGLGTQQKNPPWRTHKYRQVFISINC